jgi:hypothetical protein
MELYILAWHYYDYVYIWNPYILNFKENMMCQDYNRV